MARADLYWSARRRRSLWTAIMLKEHDPGPRRGAGRGRPQGGAGASGRNGGCALSWSAKFFTLERLFGLTEAIRLVKASEDKVSSHRAPSPAP